MAADDGIKVTIDGTEYDINDFEGRDLVAAEQAFGVSLMAELERGSMTGIYALLFCVKRAENRAIPTDRLLKSVMALKLGDVTTMMDQGDDAEAEDVEADPTPARSKAKAKSA